MPKLPIDHATRRGHLAPIPASEAKHQFGRLLDTVLAGQRVVITRRDAPKAVMLSLEDYEALVGRPSRALDALTKHYDAVVARMQTPAAATRMQAAFAATPAEIAAAAQQAEAAGTNRLDA